MIIAYKNKNTFRCCEEREFGLPVKLDRTKEWHLGIDGSSTAFGVAVYTMDFSEVHFLIFIRAAGETPDNFRSALYSWLTDFLYGLEFSTVAYEKTPEGYKPPSNHAEKAMRDTEESVKNFVSDRNYLLTRGKDYIFDIFPNSWKSFSVTKSSSNVGKVNKYENAVSVLENCGLNSNYWLNEFKSLKYIHSYDCFEALGIGRYASHFLLEPGGSIKIFKNFSRIGPSIFVAKQIEQDNLGAELDFVGGFGRGKIPRFCSLNKEHSLAENFLGLYDKEFNNMLWIPGDDNWSVYLNMTFDFEPDPSKYYLILGTRTSKTKVGMGLCKENGYTCVYW